MGNGQDKHGRRKIAFGVALWFFIVLVAGALSNRSAGASEDSAALIAGAKKEGKLVVYTTMTIDHSRKMLNTFEKKYPFIKTENYRATGVKLLNKILGEDRAKRHLVDAIEITGFQAYVLKSKGLYLKYISPESRVYKEGFKDPDGCWTSLYLLPYLMAYNTRAISRKDMPETYEGFLDPRWKGKIGFDSAGSTEWFADMLKIMGEEKGEAFMKKLADMDLQYRVGHNLISQLVIAGEFPVGTVYVSNVEDYKVKGAPVDWVGVQPLIVKFGVTGISAHAPHPNAAKLYNDFSLSKEGQMVLGSLNRLPSRPDIEIALRKEFEHLKLYPSDISLAEKYDVYEKKFRQIFLGPK